MKGRRHDREETTDSEVHTSTPSWLEGEGVRDYLRSRNQDWDTEQGSVRSKARNGCRDEHNGGTQRGRRLDNCRVGIGATYQHEDRPNQRRPIAVLEERTGSQRAIARVTLENLRQSLTDEDLHHLLDGDYIASKVIAIEYEIKRSKFAEDTYLEPPIKKIIKRTSGQTPKKAVPPSERYKEVVDAFLTASAEPTAEVVLGFYFILYKRHFHEEDPEWAGASSHKALLLVEKLANEVTDNDYRKLVTFVRKIIPAWVTRLKQDCDFPKNRPTVNSLFGGNRYFWTNRNLLYKNWQ